MILIGSGHSRLDAVLISNENGALARGVASFPKWVFGGQTTTTTLLARGVLQIAPGRPGPPTITGVSLEESLNLHPGWAPRLGESTILNQNEPRA